MKRRASVCSSNNDKLHDKLLMPKDSQTVGNTKTNTDTSCNLRIRVEADSKMKIENNFYCIKRARVLLKSEGKSWAFSQFALF